MAKARSRMQKLILLMIAVLVLSFGFYLVRNRIYLASLSLTPASVGDVIVVTEPVENDLTKVDIRFRTGSNSVNKELISTISFRLKVTTYDIGSIDFVDKDSASSDELVPNQELMESDLWQFPVNNVEKSDGEIIIDFAGVNKTIEGYSSDTYENLASFYLTGVKSKDNLQFKFDENLSQMFSKRRPVTDIWE